MIKVLTYYCESSIDVFIADSYTKRLLGYMFRKKPHYDAILLKPCNSIHTFFMKFSIDVLFLNEHMEVVKKVLKLKPGKVVTNVIGAKIVIEAKEGTFNSIKDGDKLYLN